VPTPRGTPREILVKSVSAILQSGAVPLPVEEMSLGPRAGEQSRPVLLIEDNDETSQVIGALLRLEGYRVVTARDGDEGMTHLRHGLDPCVILLDLMMPGKNGLDFRREQLQDPSVAAIPVVVCSGHDEVKRKAAELGLTIFCQKPLEIEELLRLVAAHSRR
jgi:CheY-like chemotaxis protein